MGYISTIKTAVQLFPFLAFLLTLPYMILNYRKYGSVNKLRVLIFYSFMLYLMTVYLLVILPLPDPSKIHTSYSEMVNLHPFAFVVDFFKESPFDLAQTGTWIQALKHPTFYVPAFNVLMLIPFGMYLRYYFKCGFKKTIFLTALFSLFLELTQLSGLYFLYPGPYRLADVDDIIQNTTGGGVGYLLGWFLVWLLPTRDEIDQHSFRVGTRVSGFRIGLAFLIDFVMVSILYALIGGLGTIPYVAVLALYFSLLPLWRGKTLGMALLKCRLHFDKQRWLRTIWRGILVAGYFYLIPQGLFYLISLLNQDLTDNSLLTLSMILLLFFVLLLYLILTLAIILLSRRFPFDRLAGATYESTVRVKKEIFKDESESSK